MTKVIHVGVLAEVHNLDPKAAQDLDSVFVLHQIAEAPMAHAKGTIETTPVLFTEALRHESSGGRDVYRAPVLDGIKFSDGKPLRTRDVADSLAQLPLITEQAEVTAEGNEVVFKLYRPNPRFDLTLSHPQCMIHRFDGSRDGERILGTGAYQLSADSEPGRIHLVRNPHYRGAAPIDEIVVQAYPPDDKANPTALCQAIEAGEVDYTSTLSRDDINKLSGVRKSILPGISTSLLFLNTRRIPDRRLRQAIARSIDRMEVAKRSYSNALAFAAASMLPRSLAASDDLMEYDPQEALRLVEGIDIPSKLTILTTWGPRPYLPHPRRFCMAVGEMLSPLGISIEVTKPASSKEYLDQVIAGTHDMTLSGWVADTMDPADFLDVNLASSRVPTRDNIAVSNNVCRLQSPVVDEALATYRSERTPGSLAEVMVRISEEAPLVPLAYGPTTAVVSFRVQGFQPAPLSIFPVSSLDLQG